MATSLKDPVLLVIEDNQGDYILIQEFLKEEMINPEVVHVDTFQKAKTALTSNPSKFDAILVDLTLPDAQGEKLVKEIIHLSGNRPVIVLTGYADRHFGIKSLSLGVSDYLYKDELNAFYLNKTIAYSIERMKITNQLEKSEAKYRNLFQLSPQPMWVHTLDTFRFLNVNEAAVKQYGYSKEDFLDMNLKDICLVENDLLFEEMHRNSEIISSFKMPHVLRHQKKNGEVIFVDIQSTFIEFDEKKCKLLIATNITDKLEAESKLLKSKEDLKRLNAELEERVTQRTAELVETNRQLEAFTYSVSHDLQAPLRNVLSFAQLLEITSKDSLSTDAREFLQNIMNNSKKMQNIIINLLNFFRIQKSQLKKGKVNTQLTVMGLCEELKPNAKNQIEITVGELPEITADSFMLNQVFVNLLSNAIKYTGKKEKAVIEIGADKDDTQIVFFVKDNGAGFDMKYYDKMFGMFQRLHAESEFEGTGLGLAIVKTIIEKHGGKIWAEGIPDEGATFYFSLPNGK